MTITGFGSPEECDSEELNGKNDSATLQVISTYEIDICGNIVATSTPHCHEEVEIQELEIPGDLPSTSDSSSSLHKEHEQIELNRTYTKDDLQELLECSDVKQLPKNKKKPVRALQRIHSPQSEVKNNIANPVSCGNTHNVVDFENNILENYLSSYECFCDYEECFDIQEDINGSEFKFLENLTCHESEINRSSEKKSGHGGEESGVNFTNGDRNLESDLSFLEDNAQLNDSVRKLVLEEEQNRLNYHDSDDNRISEKRNTENDNVEEQLSLYENNDHRNGTLRKLFVEEEEDRLNEHISDENRISEKINIKSYDENEEKQLVFVEDYDPLNDTVRSLVLEEEEDQLNYYKSDNHRICDKRDSESIDENVQKQLSLIEDNDHTNNNFKKLDNKNQRENQISLMMDLGVSLEFEINKSLEKEFQFHRLRKGKDFKITKEKDLINAGKTVSVKYNQSFDNDSGTQLESVIQISNIPDKQIIVNMELHSKNVGPVLVLKTLLYQDETTLSNDCFFLKSLSKIDLNYFFNTHKCSIFKQLFNKSVFHMLNDKVICTYRPAQDCLPSIRNYYSSDNFPVRNQSESEQNLVVLSSEGMKRSGFDHGRQMGKSNSFPNLLLKLEHYENMGPSKATVINPVREGASDLSLLHEYGSDSYWDYYDTGKINSLSQASKETFSLISLSDFINHDDEILMSAFDTLGYTKNNDSNDTSSDRMICVENTEEKEDSECSSDFTMDSLNFGPYDQYNNEKLGHRDKNLDSNTKFNCYNAEFDDYNPEIDHYDAEFGYYNELDHFSDEFDNYNTEYGHYSDQLTHYSIASSTSNNTATCGKMGKVCGGNKFLNINYVKSNVKESIFSRQNLSNTSVSSGLGCGVNHIKLSNRKAHHTSTRKYECEETTVFDVVSSNTELSSCYSKRCLKSTTVEKDIRAISHVPERWQSVSEMTVIKLDECKTNQRDFNTNIIMSHRKSKQKTRCHVERKKTYEDLGSSFHSNNSELKFGKSFTLPKIELAKFKENVRSSGEQTKLRLHNKHENIDKCDTATHENSNSSFLKSCLPTYPSKLPVLISRKDQSNKNKSKRSHWTEKYEKLDNTENQFQFRHSEEHHQNTGCQITHQSARNFSRGAINSEQESSGFKRHRVLSPIASESVSADSNDVWSESSSFYETSESIFVMSEEHIIDDRVRPNLYQETFTTSATSTGRARSGTVTLSSRKNLQCLGNTVYNPKNGQLPPIQPRNKEGFESLRPLRKLSGADAYDPYKSAERQMLELMEPESQKLAPITRTPSLVSSPTSAFTKFSSNLPPEPLFISENDNDNISKAETKSHASSEKSDSPLTVTSPLDNYKSSKDSNQNTISLSTLSLCSTISIESVDSNKNGYRIGHSNSARVPEKTTPVPLRRTVSAFESRKGTESRRGRDPLKGILKMEDMLYGSSTVVEGERYFGSPIITGQTEKDDNDHSSSDSLHKAVSDAETLNAEQELLKSMSEFEKIFSSSSSSPSPSSPPLKLFPSLISSFPSDPMDKHDVDLHSVSHIGGPDSAYSSLNRKSPVGGEQEKEPEVARFCHECGAKYPVLVAKFCCQCGVRRLVI